MNKCSRLLKCVIGEWNTHENLECTGHLFILFEYKVSWWPRKYDSIAMKNSHLSKIFMAYSGIFKWFDNGWECIDFFKICWCKKGIEPPEGSLSHYKIDMTRDGQTTNESEKNKNKCEHMDFGYTILLFSSWQIFAPEYLYINSNYASSSPPQRESHPFFDRYVCVSHCFLLCIWGSSSLRLHPIFTTPSTRSKYSSFVCLSRSISRDVSCCDAFIWCLYNS